ncbi:MAG: hypothetical protein K2X36_09025 [Microbacteriaceae bacterium]|nr:hypothetical protein [Microbacteriaceae bacterium]
MLKSLQIRFVMSSTAALVGLTAMVVVGTSFDPAQRSPAAMSNSSADPFRMFGAAW